ncbi:hypothetical protein D3C71_1421540 [compost metagenome]
MVCKTEQEFYQAWDKIKDIQGVVWCGCPVDEPREFSDIVVNRQKGRFETIREVKEDISCIRLELNRVLGIGKRE